MESIEKLAQRIKLWRDEYGTFGKLSGESLSQMDQAYHAMRAGEVPENAHPAHTKLVDEFEGLHTGDDDALDTLHGVITGLEDVAEECSPGELTDEIKSQVEELGKLAPVLEALYRATA